jgi:hypothetical protein
MPPEAHDLSADAILSPLTLEPNVPRDSVRVTFAGSRGPAPGALPAPFADGRPPRSALCFMVTPDKPVRLHDRCAMKGGLQS